MVACDDTTPQPTRITFPKVHLAFNILSILFGVILWMRYDYSRHPKLSQIESVCPHIFGVQSKLTKFEHVNEAVAELVRKSDEIGGRGISN